MRKLLVAVLVLALAGCSPARTDDRELTVLAAASLTEAFTRIGQDFEAANAGVKVTFSFGGSAGLAQQITAGGVPAGVFAAASPATMKTVTDAGDATGTPVVFAKNQLVIAVAKGNPKGLTSPGALTGAGIKVALCAEEVPCGAAAAKALAGVQITPVTREPDVKAALAKLKLGEVDAALVYRTDAQAARTDVDAVEFAESAQAINDYPIVALTGEPLATAFVAYVRSPPAQQVLIAAGFQKP